MLNLKNTFIYLFWQNRQIKLNFNVMLLWVAVLRLKSKVIILLQMGQLNIRSVFSYDGKVAICFTMHLQTQIMVILETRIPDSFQSLKNFAYINKKPPGAFTSKTVIDADIGFWYGIKFYP